MIAVTVIFFASMAALTFTARGVREARLPHVTAKRLTRESFTVYHDHGMTQYRQVAIPKAMFESGEIFIITTRVINGEKRDFARAVILETGLEIEGFYEVTGGMMGNELVIFGSDRALKDGDEIFVMK